MSNFKLSLLALLLIGLPASPSVAALSAAQIASLDNQLTPMGAERAGNADGSIPAWTGGLTTPPAGYQGPGRHHVDPFAADKPLFSITHANLEQYRDRLTAGQLALFAAYPETFSMPVYPTRRSGAAPQWVYDNIRKNAATARLLDGGNGFADAYGGVPFPIPQTGVEVLWNHIVRFRGTYLVRRSAEAGVQRNGAYSLVTSEDEALFRFYDPKGSFAQLNNLLFYYISFTTAPARLAGGGSLVQEMLDQVREPRQAWGYNPGQRRVRRAPTLAYDTPIEASDGLRTADDTDLYNGAPDRYDWTLLGKKEIYIPYNNYRISSAELTYDQVLTPGHVNPAHTRYELHRVWVVDGKLKPGARHIYSRRTLFLDEDSWGAAVVDQYDGRGELWRVSMAYLKTFYEVPTVWTALDTFHDLQARRYSVQWLDNEEPGTVDFSKPSPDESNFSPAALRRKASR
ncbi:MAG: DUF1329 domain-containing protein [Pseudomonas sp.]|uniref:DUF1329 domain-containing protein n=1 Tax=Pseudomonas sp. TaxID=306 RepID=UPI00339B7D78